MSSCAEMKLDQVWICEVCGLEVKIGRTCNCSAEEPDAGASTCLTCCGKPLKLKG